MTTGGVVIASFAAGPVAGGPVTSFCRQVASKLMSTNAKLPLVPRKRAKTARENRPEPWLGIYNLYNLYNLYER